MPIGLTIPLVSNQTSLGAISSTDTHAEAAKTNLKSLVLTNKGERPMHPDMGCDLSRTLFEQSSPDLIDRVKTTIAEQISKWLPYIYVNNIDVRFGDNENFDDSKIISVKIDFSLNEKKYKLESLEILIA